MRKKPLQVTLAVREPSIVELTVGDKVQLDRLSPTNRGYVPERHGALLDRGTATLALEPGFYFFKTLSDAGLRVVRGGVDTSAGTNNKDDTFPDQTATDPSGTPPAPPARGDEAEGEMPSLTIE